MSVFKDFLTYSKKDRAGIIILLAILMLSITSFIIIDNLPAPQSDYDYSKFEKEITEFESQKNEAGADADFLNEKTGKNQVEKKTAFFNFDPNTISKDSLLLLGIYSNIADRIIKYRNAGGKFSKPGDLLKIYGFNEKLYAKLSPFIAIKSVDSNEKQIKELSAVAKFDHSKSIVNLNTADTTELKSLKGIGSKLAGRIVKFRNSAGGFYSIDQLTDVYGVKPELVMELKEKIQIDDNYKKININTATAEELKSHPYIYKWNIANAIVNYRSKHGNYKQATDLMKTDLVSEELCRKIAPYLIFE